MSQTNFLKDKLYRVPIEKQFNFHNRFYWSLVLPFTMESQIKTNWCWAATAKSVSHFYSAFSPWTQCKIAAEELDKTCCNTPTPSGCNVPWYLNEALSRTQNFVSFQSGTLSYNTIKEQLQAGLVIGTRIGWNGGGGHFMVIYGLSKILGTEYLYIDDPIYGKSVLKYSEFATNYQGSGSWTHSYFTKKKFYFMWFKDLVFNPSLLKVIPEVRPLSRVLDAEINMENVKLEEPELFSAHHVYVVGLDEISERMEAPSKPSSLRVMEFEKEAPAAMYEVGLNEAEPRLLNMNMNTKYFQRFDYALNTLLKSVREDEEGELRTIRIPALNMEAAWIHFDDASKDRFMPIRLMEENGQKVFTEKDFLDYLNALKKQMGTMDELMGA